MSIVCSRYNSTVRFQRHSFGLVPGQAFAFSQHIQPSLIQTKIGPVGPCSSNDTDRSSTSLSNSVVIPSSFCRIVASFVETPQRLHLIAISCRCNALSDSLLNFFVFCFFMFSFYFFLNSARSCFFFRSIHVTKLIQLQKFIKKKENTLYIPLYTYIV